MGDYGFIHDEIGRIGAISEFAKGLAEQRTMLLKTKTENYEDDKLVRICDKEIAHIDKIFFSVISIKVYGSNQHKEEEVK